jgi:hypothetical protein
MLVTPVLAWNRQLTLGKELRLSLAHMSVSYPT